MKKIFLVIVLFISFLNSYATHNRAGEITYNHISGLTYKITITTYANTNGTSTDRCELFVKTGDGDSIIAPRVNGSAGSGCAHLGVMINASTKLNIYEATHTFSSTGTYIITMEDPNRNAGICNIPVSVNQSFCLRAELIINPFLPANNSPVLFNPPIDNACVGECFEHNSAAFDIDGDSLNYSLIACYANGGPIGGYTFPDVTSGGSISIDPLKGNLIWCKPPQVCQYSIAILIKEYKLFSGKRYYVGSVVRDMQVDAVSCVNNKPLINKVNDTCVAAGTAINFNIAGTDPNTDLLNLFASGGPFQLTPAATFTSTPATNSVNGTFNWSPNCSEVRLLPYLVAFKNADNHSPPLVDFEPVFIKVVAPASPGSLTATANIGGSITINWNPCVCGVSGSNPLVAYEIYRKNSCGGWVHGSCERGVPAYTGYVKIGTTTASTTTFTDDNNGQGVTIGIYYSYIVVANYKDESQSYASSDVCAMYNSIDEKSLYHIYVKISPNPSTERINFSIENLSVNEKYTLSISNALGQMVRIFEQEASVNSFTITDLCPGLYFYTAKTSTNAFAQGKFTVLTNSSK